MGHGIAYAAALSGFEVLMLDLTRGKAKEGLERIHQILENRFEKDFITKKELEDTKVRIKISTDYETLATKNIIIVRRKNEYNFVCLNGMWECCDPQS